MDILGFERQIHRALESHDLVGMERIINEVGPEAAFLIDFPQDFSGI